MFHSHKDYGHSHGREPLYDHGVDHTGLFDEPRTMFEVTVDVRVYQTFHLAVGAKSAEEARKLVQEALKKQSGGLLTMIYAPANDPDVPGWLNTGESWSYDNVWEQIGFVTEDACEIADVSRVEEKS